MKKMVVILCIVVLGIASLVMPVAANNVVCHEDLLSDACECNACAANLNLKATLTCDGLELTWNDIMWNDIENNAYILMINGGNGYFSPDFWTGADKTFGTSYSIPNALLPPGTYNFAILPYDLQTDLGGCYSNIICDVEMPTTCTNTPEFPSIFLPAAMIIGFLGAVLLIQRTRDH